LRPPLSPPSQELPTLQGAAEGDGVAAAPQKVKILLDGANMAWGYGTAVSASQLHSAQAVLCAAICQADWVQRCKPGWEAVQEQGREHSDHPAVAGSADGAGPPAVGGV
jgi:hypothetical protein